MRCVWLTIECPRSMLGTAEYCFFVSSMWLTMSCTYVSNDSTWTRSPWLLPCPTVGSIYNTIYLRIIWDRIREKGPTAIKLNFQEACNWNVRVIKNSGHCNSNSMSDSPIFSAYEITYRDPSYLLSNDLNTWKSMRYRSLFANTIHLLPARFNPLDARGAFIVLCSSIGSTQ